MCSIIYTYCVVYRPCPNVYINLLSVLVNLFGFSLCMYEYSTRFFTSNIARLQYKYTNACNDLIIVFEHL